MFRRTFLAMIAVLGMAATANAGTVYAYLVIDPATTAGAGIATIPGGGGTNLAVTSSRSGAGSFHVYAVDDADNSNGLRSFFVAITPGSGGTVTSVSNRSPNGQWDDNATFGNGSGPFVIGFDSARTTTPLLGGSQSPTNTPQVGGLGITAGNFQALTSAASYSGVVSGQWGNYADPKTSGTLADGHVRNAVLLGEGLYTGAAPSIDITTSFASGGTGFNSWISAGFPNAGSFTTAVGTTQTLSNTNPFVSVPEPATLSLLGLAMVGGLGVIRRRRS